MALFAHKKDMKLALKYGLQKEPESASDHQRTEMLGSKTDCLWSLLPPGYFLGPQTGLLVAAAAVIL